MPKNRTVRVWIGTRKGAYVARSDERRRSWSVAGPMEGGSDVFHVAPDPRQPGTAYLLGNNGWWGPAIHRTRDHGRTWSEVSVPGTPRTAERKPPVEAPSAQYPVKNLWHLTPGPEGEPGTVFLGVDPASLWRSEDEGISWEPVAGLNDHPTRPQWNPGAGGMCLHTLLIDPGDPHRMFAGISAAGLFRSEDCGAHWTPVNRGVLATFLPNPRPEVGQCIHKVTFDATDPARLYRQDHCGIYVSSNRGDRWVRIGRPLEDDFGFVVATSPARPEEAYFVPLIGETRTTPGGQFQAFRWSAGSRRWSPLVRRGAFPGAYGTHREGMAMDDLDPAGLYVGTTTGQLFVSPDAGRSWSQVPFQFPGIHSVEVTLG